MIWISIVVLVCYVIFILWVKNGLSTTNKPNILDSKQHSIPYLSVIIPFRNEEKRIIQLLKSLKSQVLAHSKFEIIFVDDQSTDSSFQIVTEFIRLNPQLTCGLIQIEDNIQSNKKNAIYQAILHAKGELIVQTDADTSSGKYWLSSIYNFQINNAFDLLILPVYITPNNTVISSFDSMDYSSLQAIGLGTAKQGYPILCSAANLVYQKSLYLSVKKTRDDQNLSSGDDVFLLQSAIKEKYKIETLVSREVLVETPSSNNYNEFIEQRKRWVSKNSSIQDLVYQSVAILGLSCNLMILYSLFYNIIFALTYFMVKVTVDFVLLKNYYSSIKKPLTLVSFIFNSFIYPFFLVYIVTVSYSTKNSWKGRKVNS